MKILYLPNEPDETDPSQLQVGPRGAFESYRNDGTISELLCYSFLSKYHKTGDARKVQKDLIEIAGSFRPDVIIWQHVSDFPIDQDFVSHLSRAANHPLFIYHEADIFSQRGKPVTPAMQVLMSNSDFVVLCGLEPLSELMRKNGAKNIRYLPHSFDTERFGQPWTPPQDRKYNATMIASPVRMRRPPFYFPGGRKRIELAHKLTKNLGATFALYGNGWKDIPTSQGPLPFAQQETAIRQGWISVNWDHFDNVAYYFSDRLPISLAAGVVHVTSHHEGYGHLFGNCPGLYVCKSVDEAVSCVDWLLSRPKFDLIDEGLGAMNWAKANLSAEVVYKRLIEMCKDGLTSDKRNARS